VEPGKIGSEGNMTKGEIMAAALLLTNEERVELADGLMASLDQDYLAEVERAWMEEIDRPEKAMERGETEGETVEDVIEALRGRKGRGE
jgi:hypothetical protein